ncbi:MAG: polyphosphate polymerase domain-containing protein [Lachnospiraceae bacterium]|nr:polyphosphate polymerase domain-containing protein [Lachnospiraceae bacterium]
MDFRHEYKFMITIPQSIILQERISTLMKRDSYGDERGSYEIRSVYFDDKQNSCYLQNEAGTDPRAKYRIRCYNASDQRIVLEKKIKQNGMNKKLQQDLTKEQYRMLVTDSLENHQIGLPESFHEEPPLVQELLLRRQTQFMVPKIIVAYERVPFVEKVGNVRVTFDQGISSSKDFTHFFHEDLHKRPIMPVGKTLMEIKFDEFIPGYIKEALEVGKLSQSTFSKYYLCRRHEL